MVIIIIIIIINDTLARSLETVVTECKDHPYPIQTLYTRTYIFLSCAFSFLAWEGAFQKHQRRVIMTAIRHPIT